METETFSLAPVWFVDVVGSALMIVFSFLSVRYVIKLKRVQSSNMIWTYMLWLSLALAGFAASRGVGHIVKRLLLLFDMRDLWVSIRPFSGAFNTLAFVVVAAITLFFQHVQKINKEILKDKKALEDATKEVMHLNRNLESAIAARTIELSRSEKKYRKIFEGSMDTIFILDDKGRFVDINPAGLDVFEIPDKNEIIGRELASFFVNPGDYVEMMSDLGAKGFLEDRACTLRSRDGSEIHMLLSATTTRDQEGRSLSYEGIAKDITARIQMERQLQRAEKLASLGQISTGIAHEINNPLGIMLGYTQLLIRDQEPDSQTHDDLKIIEKHARNCKTVVEDLLKFSRSTPTKKRTVIVNDLINEVVSLVAHQFEMDKIGLTTGLDPDLPGIVADDEKLKQVFMNLLMNAKQAVRKDGNVTISTLSEPQHGRISIVFSDNGCGIPEGIIDKIFDPFFTTKPVGEGTGLGLSVSYGIIQDHNGRIEVKSVPGKGSSFIIFLPCRN